MSRASRWSQPHRNNEQGSPVALTGESICFVWEVSSRWRSGKWNTSLIRVFFFLFGLFENGIFLGEMCAFVGI